MKVKEKKHKKTKAEIEEQKKTAAISKERLRRITKTRKHHIRNTHRVVKYGTKSFVRNTWLSVAAIAIMAVTLIVLSVTLIAANAMRDAITDIEQKVDISIYIKQSATADQVHEAARRIEALESVSNVTSTSPEEAYRQSVDKLIRDNNIKDKDQIAALREAPNKIPWTLNVKLKNLNETDELQNFVENDETLTALLDEVKKPSYATDHRENIDRIAEIMNRIELIGLIAAGVFAIIATLVVFNTIRMAIFNRKEEIYMMRLVGASRSFIVGPFVVEASLYGVVAAIISGAAVYSAAFGLRNQFGNALDSTLEIMKTYWYFAAAALLVVGIMIGIISSLLATRKYLKNK